MDKKHINTNCVQAGYEPKSGEARILPIYQSTTFKYESSEQMAKLFDLEAEGYFYTRLQDRGAGRRYSRYADVLRSGGKFLFYF